MAIFYQVKAAKNPTATNESNKFYARIKTTGTIDAKELAKRVSARTGISEGIIASVLCDAMTEVTDIVTMGYRVQLPSIGSIYLTLKSSSSDTAEDVNDENIKSITVRLLASSYFKGKINEKIKFVNFDKEVVGTQSSNVESDSTTGNEESGETDNSGSSGDSGDEEYPV